MRKIACLYIFLFLFIITSCDFFNKNDTSNEHSLDTKTLNVLSFNDLHGHIEKNSKSTNGLANAAYLVDQIRNEDDLDNTLLIANGDMFQETAISRVSYGEVVLDSMSEMGFDAFILGNHEFDWGIDRITAYFDGKKENGEASFPLLNANIYNSSTNTLLGIENSNIYSSTMITKNDVKIGIIGFIGDVYDSINRNMVDQYKFKSKDSEIKEQALALGSKLKDNGADIILVGIHGGDSSGAENYTINQELAKLKYNNEYLIDAVMNGHTHTEQLDEIKRTNGVSMPIIQSQEYTSKTGDMNEFGRIDLQYSTKTKKVTSWTSKKVKVSTAGTKTNENVEKIIEKYYNNSKDVLEEVYCQNEYTFSKNSDDIYKWTTGLMMATTNATAAISNNGGIRAGVSKGNFGFNEIYNVNPFDNHIILTTIKGSDLREFIELNGSFEFYGCIDDIIDDNKEYKLAIIDYVFFSSYFDKYRKNDYIDTNLILRDIMILDLKAYGATTFNASKAYQNIHISSLL